MAQVSEALRGAQREQVLAEIRKVADVSKGTDKQAADAVVRSLLGEITSLVLGSQVSRRYVEILQKLSQRPELRISLIELFKEKSEGMSADEVHFQGILACYVYHLNAGSDQTVGISQHYLSDSQALAFLQGNR